jgi:hypothetical protein
MEILSRKWNRHDDDEMTIQKNVRFGELKKVWFGLVWLGISNSIDLAQRSLVSYSWEWPGRFIYNSNIWKKLSPEFLSQFVFWNVHKKDGLWCSQQSDRLWIIRPSPSKKETILDDEHYSYSYSYSCFCFFHGYRIWKWNSIPNDYLVNSILWVKIRQ